MRGCVESLGIEILRPDRIQSRDRVIAGYLAGPLIESYTVNDLIQILMSKDIFKANGVTQMEIEPDLIKVHNQRMDKLEKRVRALQVTVPKEVKAVARSCFQRTFPSQPRPDYPLGLQFRFVPNIIDKDFAVPPRARDIAVRLRSRQADFLSRCHTREYDHIKNLHSSLPEAEFVVLSRVLMGLKSKNFPNRFLFIAVEQAYYGDPVRFTYLADRANEVDAIIPVLPLILGGELGAATNDWFKPSAKLGMEGLKYDPPIRAVVPDGNNLLNVLDQQGKLDDMDSDESGYEDVSADQGFVIEFGSLELEDEYADRTRILQDDSASVGTMGFAVTPGFIDPDNRISPQPNC